MEEFLGHAAVSIEPVLGADSEAFDTIDAISPDGFVFLLAQDHMAVTQPERGMGPPSIGVVQRTFSRMRLDPPHDRYLVTRCNRYGLDFAIAFDNARLEIIRITIDSVSNAQTFET
ncbi:hypothetical protein [Burkholderia sp. TSV86]|uniref:hypothetical protein n=1 Tax=Burkholderia sp. TSV86 TaxID=1385594 RepID=UPI0012E3E178|nr:hypothetical protein [Burkholderia sp. TSV86]